MLQTKQQVLGQLHHVINQENGMSDKGSEMQQSQSQQFKYFTGKGNNAYLVKMVFRQRGSQWAQVQKKKGLEETSLEQANFIWTQIKRQHIMECFPTFKKLAEPSPLDKTFQHQGSTS